MHIYYLEQGKDERKQGEKEGLTYSGRAQERREQMKREISMILEGGEQRKG